MVDAEISAVRSANMFEKEQKAAKAARRLDEIESITRVRDSVMRVRTDLAKVLSSPKP